MEFTWLKKIDFFPERPKDFSGERTICIGTKSRNMGDALALTTLPAKLKARYPGLKITTYPRGFNRLVFRNNPAVSGASHFPDRVYGDDSNWGSGQLIQLKEQFFELPVSPSPRPELHLSASEIEWAKGFLAGKQFPENAGKPLCILHPWGSTQRKVARVELWDQLVARWRDRVRFWQVGVEGHGAVQGCEYYHLTPPSLRHARGLFALVSRAQGFIGVDSGPMHVARAFEVPSLIFLSEGDPDEILRNREGAPYFLLDNRRFCTLYRENEHVALHQVDEWSALARADAFLERIAGNGHSGSAEPKPARRKKG